LQKESSRIQSPPSDCFSHSKWELIRFECSCKDLYIYFECEQLYMTIFLPSVGYLGTVLSTYMFKRDIYLLSFSMRTVLSWFYKMSCLFSLDNSSDLLLTTSLSLVFCLILQVQFANSHSTYLFWSNLWAVTYFYSTVFFWRFNISSFFSFNDLWSLRI
jgi:hypothetical protein